MITPPPCLLPLHILRPAGLLLPLFLTQDVVNALSDLFGFFHFLFQRKIPPVERFPLGGQLGILRFPCLYRQGGLAVHHAFQIVVRRREQDLLGFGQMLFPFVLEVNVCLTACFIRSIPVPLRYTPLGFLSCLRSTIIRLLLSAFSP